jgi:diadenosine tetraphosphate (Ap4A) HIT family hydrolase
MIRALLILKARLDLELNPHGYNFGANCGAPAGQTIMHLHLHLIPRYSGDMENPKGGVRGVIPEKQHY